MNKEQFEVLMEHLNKRIDACEKTIPADDKVFESLTISAVRDLKNFVHAELEAMTRIVMVDLYHVIGMGQLSPQQMMKFTFAMQKYLAYRPILKTLEGNGFTDLDNLPKYPEGTKYTLIRLAPITLHAGNKEKATEVDADTIGTATIGADLASLAEIDEPPYTVSSSKLISVKKDHLEDLWNDLGTGGTLETLENRIRTCGTYLGITWHGFVTQPDGDVALGKITTTNVFIKLRTIQKEKYHVA